MARITIIDERGKRIEVKVSNAVAAYINENDSYMKRLKNIDDRHFRLIHFEKRAWENMRELSTLYSAEEEALGMQEKLATFEWAEYQQRLDRCRRDLGLLQSACTPIQWRRYELHKAYGYSIRKIAAMEGCSQVAVWKSISIVEKKIKEIFGSR